MPCLLCGGSISEDNRKSGFSICIYCVNLRNSFHALVARNKEAAYNWALSKVLDLAGDITGVKPGDSFLEVENGELGIRTVNKIKTTIARDVPPELRNNDGQEKETE